MATPIQINRVQIVADEPNVNTLNHYLRRLIPAEFRMEEGLATCLETGEAEIHLLYEFVSAGDTVIDVGAHLGCYSMMLARITGPRGRVIAVEPQPELSSMLRRGANRLNLAMDVMSCALSDKIGLADLTLPGNNDAGATLNPVGTGRRITVRTATLDALRKDLNKKMSFVKIDVQGHELPVLRGGQQFLQSDRPTLLIEIEQRLSPTPMQQTFEFLQSLGYEGCFFKPGGYRRPLGEFNAARHQHVEAQGSPEYVSNFFFVAK